MLPIVRVKLKHEIGCYTYVQLVERDAVSPPSKPTRGLPLPYMHLIPFPQASITKEYSLRRSTKEGNIAKFTRPMVRTTLVSAVVVMSLSAVTVIMMVLVDELALVVLMAGTSGTVVSGVMDVPSEIKHVVIIEGCHEVLADVNDAIGHVVAL